LANIDPCHLAELRQRPTLQFLGLNANWCGWANWSNKAYCQLQIWRPALPSPYRGNIFRVPCDGAAIVSYQDVSVSYESRRAFVGLLAFSLLALSTGPRHGASL
jgi:hypothetical protein